MAKVAVLGLGAMGSRMAKRLTAAGHKVTVWNRTSEACAELVAAGARSADSPRSAVSGVDFAISMVRDDAASRAVWLDAEHGALEGLRTSAVAIESSTLTVAFVRSLAARFASAGVKFLDAPVAGSRPQAEAAQLIYLVGGDAGVLALAEPVLRCMGGGVHHVGVAGDGAAVKLAVNVMLAVQVAALAEIVGFITKTGIDPARAVEILASTPVVSPAAKGAIASMLSGSFAPMFPSDLAEKDLGYALGAAAAAGTAMPLAEATRAVFAEGIAQGFGPDHLTGIVRLYS